MESKVTKTLPKNPREGTNPFSILCFCYTMPIFFKGRKKNLQQSDLYKELKEHKSDLLGDKLCNAWEKEIETKTKINKEPSLLIATLKVFGWKLSLLGFILFLLEFLFKVSQPFFLGGLISFYSTSNNKDNIDQAYLYAGAVILTTVLNFLFMHSCMFATFHMGMKIRVAMCSMIYRKSLRLSKAALGGTTSGQIVNLLTNDVGRFDLSVVYLHFLWIGPLETIAITYLMYLEINVAAFAGIAFILASIPLQVFLGKKTSTLRLKTAKRTDERVRMMNEIIQGIQGIKMYTWEKPFAELVAQFRNNEIYFIRYASYIRGILFSLSMFLTRLSIFMSLGTYVLLGYFLSAEKAFVITAYYNVLKPTMTVFFPQGIGLLAETLVSCKRIQIFMQYKETEIKDDNLKSSTDSEYSYLSTITKDISEDKSLAESNLKLPDAENNTPILSETGIDLSNINAKWDPSCAEYTLENVSLKANPGTLVAVIGPVGAGKSSLFQVILGELPIDEGTIKVNGSISYASQEPWLFTGTVRQNILFGLPMDRKRYKTVIKRCALERDLKLFPNADKTIVGESGASLSGGQKARISLARAVYRRSSIYLLDDPLSAVDTNVGRHLFDQCIRDFLRSEIVILITHQLQFLQHADQIVILDHGKVSAVGSYDTLRDSSLDFAKMLAHSEKDDDIQDNSHFTRRSTQIRKSFLNSKQEIDVDDLCMQIEESQEQGSIGLSLYSKYFKAGGGFCFVSFMAFTCVLLQITVSSSDWFLAYWVHKEATRTTEKTYLILYNRVIIEISDIKNIKELYSNYEVSNDSRISNMTSDYEFKNRMWMTAKEGIKASDGTDFYIFTAIILAIILLTLFRSFLFVNVAMKASRNLHNNMFNGVTRATMYFFNTNPSGRILNRFSKDMGQVDEIVPSILINVIQIFLQLFGIVIVVAIINPYFLIPTAVIAVIFYFLRIFYLKTSRNVKRIEAVTRSPIYSHLAASLNGLSTIRAFGAQKILIREFDNHQDLHSSAFYMFITTSRSFGFWLDCFSVIYIAIVTLSFFFFETDNIGNIGLAITQAMGLAGMVQWGMRQSAELENRMTAVERVVAYESVDPEVGLEAPPEKKPPKGWPQNGKIKFDKLSLRYSADLNSDFVLKSLNFEIAPKEKIGIVGRTGAGKSSLINALFRLSYTEGSIIIDGIDINKVGLHDLRSKISIIPQEPVLFSGTMRYNLDPFNEYSDSKIWEALDEVKLKEVVIELAHGLQSKISEGGSNFSVGQQQLVCLARAILRENKILVMDEATANVDPQTDNLIQATIRSKFKDCTVLTIAHRLHTVMDSDKVLVMDAGKAVEFGTPYELLTESETKIFHGMVSQLGKSTFDGLLKIAEKAHKKNQGV